MNLDGKAIAATAHLVTVLLVVFGTVASGQSAGFEAALAGAITAAAGLISSAVVVHKYIHHAGDSAQPPA